MLGGAALNKFCRCPSYLPTLVDNVVCHYSIGRSDVVCGEFFQYHFFAFFFANRFRGALLPIFISE